MSKQTPPPAVNGVTETDVAQWLHNPVTKAVWKYLADYRERLKEVTVGQWEQGALQLSSEQEARGRVLVLKEVVDHRLFAAMALFYDVPLADPDDEESEQQSEDGSNTSEENPGS